MQYFDEQAGAGLREAFDAMVGGWEEEVSTVTMFGCPCYRANGKVFAALTTDAVALTRLSDDARADLEAERETEPFDANGRAVKKWVQVPIDGSDLDELEPYLRASYEAAAGSGK
ncbi:MmcQ/YjbR family DNA-binding protein [Salinirubellus sp. GCM10025818]|uniref:MmcQ/YjbR family DNA-binding protein n=1 Tax=Salinirubellus TaxID=2162630 RepID=UPI0030CBA861